MSDKDIAIGTTTAINNVSIAKKPIYLITLEDTSTKTKIIKRFLTLDKPDTSDGFVTARGVYCEESEEKITKNYSDILTTVSKDLIMEVMFPTIRICNIKSLVFKAK